MTRPVILLLLCSCTAIIVLWWAATRDRVASSMIAGAVTGVLELLVTFPLVNVTVQMQLAPSLSTMAVLQRTLSRGGIKAFYIGVTPVLVAAAPTQALRWGAYEAVCSVLGCDTTWQIFWSGLLSGIAVALCAGVPIESLKLHAISSHWHGHELLPTRHPSSPSDHDHHGHDQHVRLKGWFPTVAKKMTSQTVRFPVHHAILQALCSSRAPCDAASNAALSFSAGLLTGAVVVLVTHPLDVVKSRMQSVTSDDFTDSLHCLRHIVTNEGCHALTRGAIIRTIRSSLGTGITFMLVPMIRSAIM